MNVRRFKAISIVALTTIIAAGSLAARAAEPSTPIDGIRHELLKLPYYGVFDFLSYSYDNGNVTLMGYAYRPSLKTDAERAVKRVEGVTSVTNNVEVLPVSMNDDDVRWKTYYAIYGDSFLSRYAPGGGLLWGHRHPFASGRLLPFGPSRFPGTEPAGDYPIHIIVKGGRTLLLGVVDNQADKNVAGIKARGVSGSFGLDNELTVDGQETNTSTRK
jgi:hyperosmotically inducible protein